MLWNYEEAMGAVTTAGIGLSAASQRFDASARRTMGGQADLTAEVVERVSARQAFGANLPVIRAPPIA